MVTHLNRTKAGQTGALLLAAAVAAVQMGAPQRALAAAAGPAASAPAAFVDPYTLPPQLRAPTEAEINQLVRLLNLARAAFDARRWTEAEALFRESLALQEATFGPSHALSATTNARIAATLRMPGRNSEAEPLYRRALAINRAALGETHPETARSYNDLAASVNAQGRYAEADPLYRRALAINRAALGETHRDTVTSYSNLATNLYRQGRYLEAEPLFRNALDINRSALGEADPVTALSLEYLARNLYGQGRYAAAEPLYRKALAANRATLGDAHPDTARSQKNLALNLDAQGRYGEAEPLIRQALETDRAVLGEADPETAGTYASLASNLTAQGRNGQAEPLYRKALEINRAAVGEAHPDTATAYNNLGSNLNAQGRYGEAEQLLRKALDINRSARGEAHLGTAPSYYSLAGNLMVQGRYGEAEPLIRKASALRRAALGTAHPDTAKDDNALASVLYLQGRFGEAEPLYRKALAINRAVLGEAHPDTARSQNNLASDLYAQGRYGQAEAFAAAAVRIARQARDTAAGVGESGQAASLQRARAASGMGPEPLRSLYGNYIAVAYEAASGGTTRSAALRASAFTAAQDYTVSAAARAMAQASARVAAGSGALGGLIIRQQALAEQIRTLDDRQIGALAGGNAAKAGPLKSERETTLRALAEVDDELARAFPAYAQLTAPKALEIGALQRTLAADEGLILIVPVDDAVFSFAVSKTATAWSRLGQGATRVAQTAAKLRGQMTSETARFDRQAAFDLYSDLVAPVEGALSGVKRLYVVAAGPMGGLPLGMLMSKPPLPGSDDDDKALAGPDVPWLAERYAFSTLPAVSSLGTRGRGGDKDGVGAGPRSDRPDAAAASPFVGYGAPLLSGTNGPGRGPAGEVADSAIGAYDQGKPLADPQWLRTHFAFLEGPEIELPRMAQALGAEQAVSVHLGAAATETAVKADLSLRVAQVVAFATHGFLPGQVPGIVEPGLVFTPPAVATSQDDGVLSASEAAQLRFTADWIILSACDTASSDGTSGAEGLSSLARGFLYAGAGALLASHWPVSDEATVVLTTETLTLRHQGHTRAEALQIAMRTVRTGRRPDGSAVAGWGPQWANPAVWAPFTIIANQDR